MMKRHPRRHRMIPGIVLAIAAALPIHAKAGTGAGLVAWLPHNASTFETASRQGKFLLLDLVAVWCHWCHVMDATTYSDPEVAALIDKHFVPVQADHDARPDLAERYRDYGWPATVVFAPDGTEIVKRAGYIAPAFMAELLQAIVEDPSPEGAQLAMPESLAGSPEIAEPLRAELVERHKQRYDEQLGGLDIAQKFIDADSVEWGMYLAAQGDGQEATRVKQTLDAGIRLIDPEFGGAYQYSTHGDWDHPHYEKIMKTQNRYLRVYSKAYRQFGDPHWLDRATQAAGFIDRYFRYPEAGLVSAKDNGTPIEPLPQIDQNISAALFLLELTNHAEDPTMPMDLARHTLRLLVTEDIALSRPTDAGILLASERLAALTGESKRIREGQPDRTL